MTHRSLALAALVSAGLGLAALSVPAASAAARPSSARPAFALPASAPFAGTPRVGALFTTGAGGSLGHHFCSASVVDSPGHSLLVTAAHCVVAPGSGRARSGLVFVPGYHNGVKPYGQWRVTRVVADAKWSLHGDTDFDVAFLTVAPGAKGRKLQDVVGSEAIAFNTARSGPAVAVGYPSRTERPVHCDSTLRGFGTAQLEFDCPGMPGGTSGGPLLTGAGASGGGRGTVVGIIGGYQEGGLTPDISYSPYFSAGIAAVYRAAANQR
ncbi:serine protease [Streptacidiphilus sp. N1-12]|uniref:Serine protease n=2 Tax=Streptacidiphilus alkalitolerans TaxID=3342712 RepID=A0ABV6WTM4_9ACTN